MSSLIEKVLMGIVSLAIVVVIIGAVSYAATGNFNPLNSFINNSIPSGNTTIVNKTYIMPSTVTVVTPGPTSTPTPTPMPTPTQTPAEEQYTILMTVGPRLSSISQGDYYTFNVQVLKGTSGVDGVDVKFSTSDNSILYSYIDSKNFGNITTGHYPGSDVKGIGMMGLMVGPNKGKVTVTATASIDGKVVAEKGVQVDVT